MSKRSLEKWLQEREPAVPALFLPYLLGDAVGPGDDEDLAKLGEEGLRRALMRPGRDRAAAFDLLAADAFLTYACEEALTERDGQGALRDILTRIGERFS
jgi:hypothetical protein